MVRRSAKSGIFNFSSNVGNTCWISIVVWGLVAWLLFFHAYIALSPSQTSLLSDLRSDVRGFVELELQDEIEVLSLSKNGDKQGKQIGSNDKDFVNYSLTIDPLNTHEENWHYFFPGGLWMDTDGNPIQAHGGSLLYVPERRSFYWYGENKNGPTYHLTKHSTARVDVVGISCYSSLDLWLWKHENLVIKGDKENRSSDLHLSNVVERPKVIYNAKTNLYVMWMHVDNANYSKASLGVAISSQPEGPFQYLGSKQPHAFESRDMTVFKDDDGTAYIMYSSESNSELHISPLHDDYLGFRNVMSRVLVDQHREAPAIFKHRSIYYMVTSGCTGWAANAALLHVAESMLGPWETVGNPCHGGTEEMRLSTFYSQGAFIFPIPGQQNLFIFMADRWNATDLKDSRYVWLPLTVDGPADEPIPDKFEFPFWSRVSIRWYTKWKLPSGWDYFLKA